MYIAYKLHFVCCASLRFNYNKVWHAVVMHTCLAHLLWHKQKTKKHILFITHLNLKAFPYTFKKCAVHTSGVRCVLHTSIRCAERHWSRTLLQMFCSYFISKSAGKPCMVSHNLEELKWTILCKHNSNNLTVYIIPASPSDEIMHIYMYLYLDPYSANTAVSWRNRGLIPLL